MDTSLFPSDLYMEPPPVPNNLLLLANSTLPDCLTKTSLEKEGDDGDIINESLERDYPTVAGRRTIKVPPQEIFRTLPEHHLDRRCPDRQRNEELLVLR